MDLDDIVNALRKVFADDPLVNAAFLFGSAAHQRMHPASDVDVAVRWVDNNARQKAQPALLDRLGALGQAVGRDVHLVDLDGASPSIRRRVFSEGVCITDHDRQRSKAQHKEALREVIDWDYNHRLQDRLLRSQLEGKTSR